MLKGRVKLFFHCLFRFHREWSLEIDDKRTAGACMTCKKVYWGEVCEATRLYYGFTHNDHST